MPTTHYQILIGGSLALAAILAGRFAARLGTPLLLVFLVLGMLAGEDGPGGIAFDDFGLSYLFGSVALVVILFEGGLKTSRPMLSLALGPAFLLATFGVAVSGLLVGASVVALLGVPWPAGLLIGAMVAPTDAAAVASVLRMARLAVPDRVVAVLEIESGLNDPMSVFLTLALVQMLLLPGVLPGAEAWPDLARHLALSFLREMLGAAVLGLACGWGLLWIVRRLPDDASLLPALLLAGALALFGGAQMLDTSGFLAVYLAGIVVGNGAGEQAKPIERAYEAFAWIAQIGLFLMLGLLVNPHDMLPLLWASAAMAGVLIVLARPLAVLLCLVPFGFTWRETGFVGWVGLRGAVPIYLAMIPVLEGVPHGDIGFTSVFAIVVLSLAVQGWSIRPVARLLGYQDAAAEHG